MTSAAQSITSLVLPVIVAGGVLALRWRRMTQARRLRLERMWIVPALYLALAGFLFWAHPPQGWGWPLCVLSLVVGAAVGWQRGRLMHIAVDPATHAISYRGSPAAMLLVIALIVVRAGMRRVIDGGGADGLFVDAATLTDMLVALALGLLAAQRIEMFIRARRLIDEAKVGR